MSTPAVQSSSVSNPPVMNSYGNSNKSTTVVAAAATAPLSSGGSTPISILPAPSIQLARALEATSVDDLQAMSAFELFQKQIESGSTEASLDAMKRLAVVAITMGQEGIQTQLIPYLTALVTQTATPGAAAATATALAAASSNGTGGPASNNSNISNNNNMANIPAPSDEWLLLLTQELKLVSRFYLQSNNNNNNPNLAVANKKYAVEDFLPILERLAAVEETVVREEAVSVFAELAQKAAAALALSAVSPPQSSSSPPSAIASSPNHPTVTMWMSLIKRLVNADWFTPKVSAAGILPHLFAIVNYNNINNASSLAILNGDGTLATPLLPAGPPPALTASSSSSSIQHQPAALELLALYKELCTDETPMVRRAAAQHLGLCLAHSGWAYRDEGLAVNTLTRLCHDEQDSVRRLAVVALADTTMAYAQQSPQWTAQHWLPLLKEASTDLSWRVRHNLAKRFSEVATNIGVNKDRRLMSEQALVMACFVTLLTDVEAEVRAAAVTHLAKMVSWGGQSLFVAHLQPLLPALADDVVLEVRSKCALALMDAAHGGVLEDAIILQAFGPLFESFLQDEFHEVQLQVLTNLHKIAHLLQGLTGVVSTLMQMAKATNWRVRQAVAQLLPHLAEARGLEFFTQVLLEPAWMPLLLDPVASVRQAIVQGMPLLVKVAGDEWILQNLLPQHVKIYQQSSASYLIRVTLLQGFISAATTARGPLFPELLNIIVNKGLTQDKVANVRMVSAKGLLQIAQSLQQQQANGGDVMAPDVMVAVLQGQVRPALQQKLASGEDDMDVRYACQMALDYIG